MTTASLPHAHHARHERHRHHLPDASLNRTALSATLHCLTGCAIGEVLGMVIGTALGWGNAATIAPRRAAALAFAADAASIAVMEVVDNAVMLTVPDAMEAGLDAPLFRGSPAFALAVAAVAALSLNRWLIARGRGHAVVHAMHQHGTHR